MHLLVFIIRNVPNDLMSPAQRHARRRYKCLMSMIHRLWDHTIMNFSCTAPISISDDHVCWRMQRLAHESSPTLRYSRVKSRTHSVGMYDAIDGFTDQCLQNASKERCHHINPHFVLTFWRRNYFLNFSTTVNKMWIIQEPNMLELWNKLHFEEEKTDSIYRV